MLFLHTEVTLGEGVSLQGNHTGKKDSVTKTQEPILKKHPKNHLKIDTFGENEGGVVFVSSGFSKSPQPTFTHVSLALRPSPSLL